MPERRKATPQEIISGLRPATRTHSVIKLPRKPSKHSKASKAMLLAAFALLAAGVGLTICPEAVPSVSPAAPAPAATPTASGQNPAMAVAGGVPGAGVQARQPFVPYLGRIRPDTYADTLRIDGKSPDLLSVGDLSLRKDGRPLEVYVLLRSQLDERTEQAWRRCGMFRNEALIQSPWLRTVTVSDQEALDHLIDWHVDRVAMSDSAR